MPENAIDPPLDSVGVGCGHCGGSVYMEPCPEQEHDTIIDLFPGSGAVTAELERPRLAL